MARFRVLGIPVQVDPWFLLGLFFVYSWSGGDQIGLFAALSLGVLTLIHELGHTLTARRYGCTVSISLNLFVGWASYASDRPLTRRQHVLISLMGPFTQLAVALAALGFVHGMIQRSDNVVGWWQFGVGLSWAGVVIAFLNLLPLWPLDGGHVLHSLIGTFVPARAALRAVLVWTLVAIGLLLVLGLIAKGADSGLLADERQRPNDAARRLLDPSLSSALWAQVRALPAYLLSLPWFLLFFTGLATVQGMRSLSNRPEIAGSAGMGEDRLAEAVAAERRGWSERRLPAMPKGFTASPWLRAHLALRGGDTGGVQAALAQVTAPGRRWVLPDVPARVELAPLVEQLAEPVPLGAPVYNAVALHVMSWHGPADRLLRYAGELYAATRDPEVLFVAAAGLARRGEVDAALAWLRRAVVERPDADRVLGDPAFVPYRARPEFQRLLEELPASPHP